MKRKEKHTFYNFQFKHTAVTITNHPNIQSIDVAEALNIHPIMLYRWRQEMRVIFGVRVKTHRSYYSDPKYP